MTIANESTETLEPPAGFLSYRTGSPRTAPADGDLGTVNVPAKGQFWRTWLAYTGPGLMVSVGYMDPGNWATDLAGGSRFGYALLSVILISNLIAILLQHLALKLGIVTDRDLAQSCRDQYSKPVVFALWILCEIAIAACDLAEVIGSAIALNLLFGLPLVWGVVITSADVLVILMLQAKGFRYLEAFVATLVLTVGACFVYQMAASQPSIVGILGGLLPTPKIVVDSSALYIAIGILGATVMPHNLYLHSGIIKTRNFARTDEGRARAIKFATLDSTVSLGFAFFINAAILILAAAAFHNRGMQVESIEKAHELLAPTLGATLSSTLFAVALLASGQNSTLTGTLAGQIVMEGFLHLRMRPWIRRLITRGIAIVPAAIIAGMYGNSGVDKLLIFSQVILSLQLSFAVVPLVQFTCSKAKMGRFANPLWIGILAWVSAVVIGGLNIYLLIQTVTGWVRGEG
ncbi:MAG: divalent metal cation transporter [Phycisphaerales bacterium]|nr:divalent metal cation transporter [Phycisphaerales bacterium]